MNNPLPVKKSDKPISSHTEPNPSVSESKAEPVLKQVATPEPSRAAEKPIAVGLQAPRPGAIKHGSQNSISPIGYIRNDYDFIAARGVVLADVIIPEFWLHIATRFRPNDEITVICEDGTWYAKLLVVNCDRLWAKVFVLMHHDLTQARIDSPSRAEDDYDVDWTPSGKWTITKKSQKGQPCIKDGFLSRLEAYQWLDGFIKSQS